MVDRDARETEGVEDREERETREGRKGGGRRKGGKAWLGVQAAASL